MVNFVVMHLDGLTFSKNILKLQLLTIPGDLRRGLGCYRTKCLSLDVKPPGVPKTEKNAFPWFALDPLEAVEQSRSSWERGPESNVRWAHISPPELDSCFWLLLPTRRRQENLLLGAWAYSYLKGMSNGPRPASSLPLYSPLDRTTRDGEVTFEKELSYYYSYFQMRNLGT